MRTARTALTHALTALWLGCVAMGACSSSSSDGPDSGSSGGGGGSCRAHACKALTASDVTAATGTKFGAGTEVDSVDGAICIYSTGKTVDAGVSVLVRCCPCGPSDPSSITQVFGGRGVTVASVSGVGDAAFWVVTIPDAGGSTIDQLIAFGPRVEVIVSLSVSAGFQGIFTFDPLMAAEQLARTALSRL
jgi:hypothetical protein